MSDCSIPECTKRTYAKNYCVAHYERLRRHGSPYGGATSKGAPKRFLEQVVLKFEGDGCLLWPYSRTSDKQATMYLDGHMVSVAKYVCKAVNGPPPSETHDATHLCTDGLCVAPRHLTWRSPQGLFDDQIERGTACTGARQGRAKLSASDVQKIRLLRGKLKTVEIAEMFKVSSTTVCDIHHARTWATLAV